MPACDKDSVKAKCRSVSKSETLRHFAFYSFCLTPDRNAAYLRGIVAQRCCTADCSCLDMPFSPSFQYCFDTETLSSAHSFCGILHSTQNSFSCMESRKSTPFNSNKKTTAPFGPTAAKMHLRPNDCGSLWVPPGKSRKHPTIHRSFISYPVILFLLYLFLWRLSAGFL